jgi:alanine dehydrogenase
VAETNDFWWRSEMIVKVKELHQPQFNRMRKGQILFAFLHLAADRPLASALMEKKGIWRWSSRPYAHPTVRSHCFSQ